jgi:probable rRNA maturation factor
MKVMKKTMAARTAEIDAMKDHVVDIQWCIKDRDQMPDEDLIRQWARLTVSDLHTRGVEFCLRVVSEAEIQCLNKKYRGKDGPTNVLSFPNETPAGRVVDENGRILLGDIIVCKDVVQRESRKQQKSVEAHFAHLLVHGILHLQGHDHSVDDQASEMEAIEKRLLLNLGYDDPYL